MEIIKDIARFDTYRVDNAILTPEGYLKCDAVCVARAGTIDYEILPDGRPGVRTDFIAADELGKPDSIATLRMLPMCNGHPRDLPKGFIDATTAKQKSVGHVGENVHLDSDKLFSSILVTDKNAVEDYKKGKRGLSLAYLTDLIPEPGVHNGKAYQYRQTNRRYNHLALCDSGRAGPDARIPSLANLDGIEIVKPEPKPSQRSNVMPVTINLDGIDYADQAPEVKKALEKLAADLVASNKERTTLATNLDAITGERDALKAKVTSHEATIATMPDKIAQGVKTRSALVAVVTPHLDAETIKAIDAKSDIDLKRAVAVKAFPKMKDKIDAGNEAYLAPVFDSALEVLANTNFDAANAAARVAANGAQRTANQDSTPVTEDEARKKMIERNSGLYKGEAKK